MTHHGIRFPPKAIARFCRRHGVARLALFGSVLRDDFTTALDYIYQVLFAPTFPEDEFGKLRGQQITRIASRKGDPKTEILDFWTQQLLRSAA